MMGTGALGRAMPVLGPGSGEGAASKFPGVERAAIQRDDECIDYDAGGNCGTELDFRREEFELAPLRVGVSAGFFDGSRDVAALIDSFRLERVTRFDDCNE